jgi:hypothetical protein
MSQLYGQDLALKRKAAQADIECVLGGTIQRMASEIRTQINRQGWRIVDRPSGATHPRIDHKKRQVNADNAVDLTRAYLELRGWPRPVDFADHAARSCAINRWLGADKSEETAPYPEATDDVQRQVLAWLEAQDTEIMPEISHCHESADNADELAGRIRSLLSTPALVQEIPVRHTFKVLA